MKEKKLDRRRKYYMIFDCETATLPYAMNFSKDDKKKIAIAKPLIYDFGYTIIDKKGTTYKKVNHLVTEIFSVPAVFNTAYYADKRPMYLELLNEGKIDLLCWDEIIKEFEKDLAQVVAVGAYNSMFDFKKAIPFTENYIRNLYSKNFYLWEKTQNVLCDKIVNNTQRKSEKCFDRMIFIFRSKNYPLFDVWGLSCKYLLNNSEYKKMCVENGWKTASNRYFKTSVETCFRFCTGKTEFIEAHTALNDAEIESFLFSLIIKSRGTDFDMGIIYFPFKELGTVDCFLGGCAS